MGSVSEIITLLLLSATKFVVAAGVLLIGKGYSYQNTVLILLCGGSFGTFVFFYFGEGVNILINKLLNKKKKKKTFTKMNRFIIKVKSGYGLIGLALLTPVLFSIPLGCFLAARFYYKNKWTLPALLSAVVFWSFILPLIKLYFY